MSATHQHDHNLRIHAINRAFIIGISLNLLFTFIEFGSGFYFNSLALVSDAGHNLSDVVSLILAFVAFKLTQVKPTKHFTYGYKRSTILASLVNAVILLIVVGGILLESIEKIQNPKEIKGVAVAWVAGIGIVINTVTALLFRKDKDLNIKGAYIHLLADALVSVGVLISGIIISYTGWYMIDSIMGIVIAIVILISTWNLLYNSVRLSLDGVPNDIDINEIEKVMEHVAGVQEVHHIHVWALSTTENALTAHVIVDEISEMDIVKCKLKDVLNKRGIQHVTLEFEAFGTACNNMCF